MDVIFSSLTFSTFIFGGLIGIGFIVLIYIKYLFNNPSVNKNKNDDIFAETLKSEKLPDKKKALLGKSKLNDKFNNKKKENLQISTKTKKKLNDNLWVTRIDKKGFTHPWLLTSLKGHTGKILDLDFSANGKYLATCGEDRTVFLWDCRDLNEKNHKSIRFNIEFDHATFVKWSPDSKAFIIHKYYENTIEVYKIEKKKDNWLGQIHKLLTFPKAHDFDVIALSMANNGKYIMTCSNKTDMILWDLKGQIITTIDTYLMTTTCAKISPCSRFITASGFAPDAKIWEVIFTKDDNTKVLFKDVKRVFDLSGHNSGIFDVDFDSDTTHMATISKDGTWRLYNIQVDYKNGEYPHLLSTGTYEKAGNFAKLSLSPLADVLAVITANFLQFFITKTGQLDYSIELNNNATAIKFDASGKYLYCTCDKSILIFHNVTGVKCQLLTAEEKLKQSHTSATKERLEKLISDSQEFLNNYPY